MSRVAACNPFPIALLLLLGVVLAYDADDAHANTGFRQEVPQQQGVPQLDPLTQALLQRLDDQAALIRRLTDHLDAVTGGSAFREQEEERQRAAAEAEEEARRQLESGDNNNMYKNFSGVRIKQDNAMVAFGVQGDTKLVRTARQQLVLTGSLNITNNITASELHVTRPVDLDPDNSSLWGAADSPGITVGGMPLYDYVRQIAHDTCTKVVDEVLAVNDAGCSWRVLLPTESGATGALSDGLADLADAADWHEEQIIRLAWNTTDGALEYIEFVTAEDPFVDRTGSNTGSKADNQLFEMQNFTTNHEDLAGLVATAGGAYLCMGNAGAWDTAWGVIPLTNAYWQIGCNSGGWTGVGAYYGEEYYGAGWVGYKTTGQRKAPGGGTAHLGLQISVCD